MTCTFYPARYIKATFYSCDASVLKDSQLLRIYATEASKELRLGSIKAFYLWLNPVGFTASVVLPRGQLIISTNVNQRAAVVYVYTGAPEADLSSCFRYLSKTLKAQLLESSERLFNNNTFTKASEAPKNVTKAAMRGIENDKELIISILGSAGGVAKALLSILNRASADKQDPINSFIRQAKLHLVDIKQNDIDYYQERYPNLKYKLFVHSFDVNHLDKLNEHLMKSNTSMVIDVSYGDTVNMLRCCDNLGIIYINTALECPSVDENELFAGFPLQERYRIFESHRDEFNNTTAIVCSGMNPGVVQWMALDLMKRYPTKKPLGCYIVEEDTSFFKDEELAKENTLYTTWFTKGFLDEAIYSFPTFNKKHHSLFLYSQVYELEFKVTLGEKAFWGNLMPHEEALSLSKLFDMETGFIYKINEHTTDIIKNNLQNVHVLWDYPMEILDPGNAPLKGEDLVGILLVFDDMEAYMYNSLSNKSTFEKYGTNATYIQVASGVYGAMAVALLDSIPQGVYHVDELLLKTSNNYGKYVCYHLGEIITGENSFTDGDLINRMRNQNTIR